MHWSLTSFSFLALQITLCFAATLPRAEPVKRLCGSENPPPEILAQAQAFATSSVGPQPAAHAPVVINTYFHVVATSAKQGQYTQTKLNNQVNSSFPLSHFELQRFITLSLVPTLRSQLTDLTIDPT